MQMQNMTGLNNLRIEYGIREAQPETQPENAGPVVPV